MFWRKKPAGKKLSQKDIIANQIEQLGPGQSLSYKLPKISGGGLAVIRPNPLYPGGKQKKYIVTREEADFDPYGSRSPFFSLDKPMEVAHWVVDQRGELFIGAGEGNS